MAPLKPLLFLASWRLLAGGLGFEPRLAESESAVLPLDDPPPRIGADDSTAAAVRVAGATEIRVSFRRGAALRFPVEFAPDGLSSVSEALQSRAPSAGFRPTDHFAALDLGTNNCRLLVARPAGSGFRVVDAFSRIVRLGEGLAATGALSADAMARTLDALKVCADKIAARRVAGGVTSPPRPAGAPPIA